MNRFLYLILLFSLLLITGIAHAQMDSLVFGGMYRTYLVHLPAAYTGSTALPLVIALHSLSGSASGFETMTGFSNTADTANFIVVYPNGTGSPASWNCGGNWSATITNTNDDVGFISTLIDSLTKRYNIDSTRIYAAGFSNGSMMAYRLAAELSNRIAAIAAGSAPLTLRTINPLYPVAIIHFHALDDSSIPYNGITDSHAPVYFPPIDTLMAIWKRINGCTTSADTIYNTSGVLGRKWIAVNTKADVVLYRTNTGGHAWPLGSLAQTDIAWNFLSIQKKNYTPILPVEIIKFAATAGNSLATLIWITLTEVNNYGFEIEHRAVNRNQSSITRWTKIGFVQGNGTSNAPHEYSFTDARLVSGRYAYRLKQIDNCGAFKYSQETEVVISAPREFALFQNYPDPFNPSTHIDFSIPQSSHVTLKIYDVLGKEVATLVDGAMGIGTYTTTWNALNCPSGVYFYRLTSGSYTMTRKLIVLR